MEELTLKEKITKLELQETTFQVDLQTITERLYNLRKEEKQQNLPRISTSDLDKLLSLIEDCIIDNRIDIGNNCDIYYSINDNEIDAEVTLTSDFADEVISNVKTAVEESDLLAIIDDMEESITTVEKVF